jgi:hypothetical protein
MTYTSNASNSSRLSLIGYAFIGKGFAYLGFPPIYVGEIALLTGAAVETHFTVYHEPDSSRDRSISTRQILENDASVVGQAGEQAEGTKVWRTDWWNIIVKDTLYGPHFWTGRGFGLNLADADGFQVIDPGRPQLRSPHNVHMTMLARAGVPGLALWGVFLASWLGTVMHAMATAWLRGRTEWAGLFLFTGCYASPSSSMPPSMSRLRDPCRASGSGVWSVLALEQ